MVHSSLVGFFNVPGPPSPHIQLFFQYFFRSLFTGHFLSFDFSFAFHIILAKPKAFKGKYINIETSRETREGWPLLTVETEVNGDSKSTNEKSPSLVGFLGLPCRFTRFLFCLRLLSAEYKIFFSSPYTILTIVDIAQ